MKSFLNLCIVGAVVLSTAAPTLLGDDMYIWVEEVGGNVIFLHQGSIDLTGFPTKVVATANALIAPDSGGYANSYFDVDIYDGTLQLGTTRTFGTGPIQAADSTFGDYFGLGNGTELGVPLDYVSGTPISGSLTFLSTTLALLGVNPTPFSFSTTSGSNTIHLFTDPVDVAAAEAAEAAEAAAAAAKASARADLLRKIRKLKKKARKARKRGQLAKAKKRKRKIKKLKQQLAAL